MPKPRKASDRSVLYPSIEAQLCVGDKGLTAEMFKELLGWEEIPEGAGKDSIPLLKDLYGKPVRCVRNAKNRPFDITWAKTLCQDLLTGNQRFNGETIIFDRYGECQSGQHRGVATILAQQKLDDPAEREHWLKFWPDGVVRWESVVVFGIDDSPETTRTFDNTKPRSDEDVIITSGYFPKAKPEERKRLAHILAYAVRFLWHRTLRDENAYNPYRTKSEVLEFINRHPRLLEAIKHVVEEDGQDKDSGKIKHYVSLGTAAGLLYLMGTSSSDRTKYDLAEHPGDRYLKFDHWDTAKGFFTELARKKRGKMVNVYAYRRNNATEDSTDPHAGYIFGNHEGAGSITERVAVLCKAWLLWLEHGKVRAADLTLDWLDKRSEDAGYRLNESVSVGGIDGGDLTKSEEPDPEAPTQEEIAKRAEQVKADREAVKSTDKELKAQEKSGKLLDELAALHNQYNGALLLIKRVGGYAAWGQDALEVSARLKLNLKLVNGTQLCMVPATGLEDAVQKLQDAGNKVVVLENAGKALKRGKDVSAEADATP